MASTTDGNFVVKLYRLLEEGREKAAIHWATDGLSFVIRDRVEMEARALAAYFKTSKLDSFTRQLRGYGFARTKPGQRVAKAGLAFHHPLFKRGHPDLLAQLTRRKSSSSESSTSTPLSEGLSPVVAELGRLRASVEESAAEFSAASAVTEGLRKRMEELRRTQEGRAGVLADLVAFLAPHFASLASEDTVGDAELADGLSSPSKGPADASSSFASSKRSKRQWSLDSGFESCSSKSSLSPSSSCGRLLEASPSATVPSLLLPTVAVVGSRLACAVEEEAEAKRLRRVLSSSAAEDVRSVEARGSSAAFKRLGEPTLLSLEASLRRLTGQPTEAQEALAAPAKDGDGAMEEILKRSQDNLAQIEAIPDR